MTLEEIQVLYDTGSLEEAMAAVWAEIYEERRSDDPERGALMIIRAWCHWRRQEWDDSRDWLVLAEGVGGAELKVKELRAYFAAYRDKNDLELRLLARDLPQNTNVQNALIIRARDEGSVFTIPEVGSIVYNHQGTGVAAANLQHNGARFFLAKARDDGDRSAAVGMLDRALRLYGMEAHWHHRAAANHYKSQALEILGRKEEAAAAARESLRLWEKAVELDPLNNGFRGNLENARTRVEALSAA